MVYIDCFYYAIDLPNDELSKYDLKCKTNIKNIAKNENKITKKLFDKYLETHNNNIIKKFLYTNEDTGNLNNKNMLDQGESKVSQEFQKDHEFQKDQISPVKTKTTLKSYKSFKSGLCESVNNTTALEGIVNKTAELLKYGFRDYPELI